MDLTDQEIISLLQYSFVRLDGAWFLSLAKSHGVDTAWNTDVEVWKHFSYLFGKKLRSDHISQPVWPDSFIEAMEILAKVLKIEGREVILEPDRIIIRVTDCETQKAIAKANVADCGIATIYTYQGLVRGLFNKEIEIDVEHTKNLNHGDPYCEVIIRLLPYRK
ncbi:MAG: hypothetical protein GX808_00915 [Syntrophomonadaceae bacterium]|nr:hypothetical protein [Syntrophomonadaceae bacterium]